MGMESRTIENDPRHTIWLSSPAADWFEALPLGNGLLGAMVFGGVEREEILLNHERLYRGEGRYREQEVKAHLLPAIRKLFLSGDVMAGNIWANQLLGGPGGILKGMTGEKNRVDPYQPAGSLIVRFPGANRSRGCRRALDLRTAAATVECLDGEGRGVVRTVIAHSVLPVVLVHIRAEGDRPFSAELAFTRENDPDCALRFSRGEADFGFHGLFIEGIEFVVSGRVLSTDGELAAPGPGAESGIGVKDARELLLAVTAATSVESVYPAETVRLSLDDLSGTWEELYESHQTAHRELYDRFDIDLGIPRTDVPTDERVAALAGGGRDNDLFALYFRYGRYLLISSSRPGGLPANLQGVWNGLLDPPWECDFHNDINLQMNYWIAESTGLAECAEPLFDFIERFVPNGREAARSLYGCEGVFIPIQTDPWGRATPESRGWDVWTGAAAWLAQHLWWRFEYSGDLGFLKERAYPFIKEVAAFYESYLVEDARGRLVTVPSQSPENFFVGGMKPVSLCVGATMDFELIRDVLGHGIEASEFLGVDGEKRERWRAILAKIPPLAIGRHGQLQEWLEDYEEGEVNHRHLSHLVGLFPGENIDIDETPGFAEAARISLQRRMDAGGQEGGWSAAWAACLLARLRDPEQAYERLRMLVGHNAHPNLLNGNAGMGARMRLFQIDGNFGGAAAVVEMLFQSHRGVLRLLPALPAEWREGRLHGVLGRGGFRVDFDWADGKVAKAAVFSLRGGDCTVEFDGASAASVESEGVPVRCENSGPRRLRFAAEPGRRYEIRT